MRHSQHAGLFYACVNLGKVSQVESMASSGVKVKGERVWHFGDFELLTPSEAAFFILSGEEMLS